MLRWLTNLVWPVPNAPTATAEGITAIPQNSTKTDISRVIFTNLVIVPDPTARPLFQHEFLLRLEEKPKPVTPPGGILVVELRVPVQSGETRRGLYHKAQWLAARCLPDKLRDVELLTEIMDSLLPSIYTEADDGSLDQEPYDFRQSRDYLVYVRIYQVPSLALVRSQMPIE